MKYDDLKRLCAPRTRKKPSSPEHDFQVAAIQWFRLQYPELRDVLFAVPNGSVRDKITGARLKAEGVTPGVSDLLLLKPNRFYGCLAIEMKTPKGRQSDSQKEWQKHIEAQGNKYVVCHDMDEFQAEVKNYLSNV